MDQQNSTLDELLGDPLIRLVMASDGVRIDEIRHLVEQARARMIQTNWQKPEYTTRMVSYSFVGWRAVNSTKDRSDSSDMIQPLNPANEIITA